MRRDARRRAQGRHGVAVCEDGLHVPSEQLELGREGPSQQQGRRVSQPTRLLGATEAEERQGQE
jgi:hypothetical protein